jgi:hypothetical protein
MLRKLIFVLACAVVPMFAAATPAAAQDMHFRQVSQRCHAPTCFRYNEDGVSTIYFVVQHQTFGQNLIVCEHSYAPCRIARREFQQGALPTVDALLPPLTPSPTTPGDDAVKDEEVAPPVEGENLTPGVQEYRVAPGALQRQVE